LDFVSLCIIQIQSHEHLCVHEVDIADCSC